MVTDQMREWYAKCVVSVDVTFSHRWFSKLNILGTICPEIRISSTFFFFSKNHIIQPAFLYPAGMWRHESFTATLVKQTTLRNVSAFVAHTVKHQKMLSFERDSLFLPTSSFFFVCCCLLLSSVNSRRLLSTYAASAPLFFKTRLNVYRLENLIDKLRTGGDETIRNTNIGYSLPFSFLY